ncbi:MAG TPA: Spy/CpxP family protein refolding chaperone [Longimicrobiales bacterium]
MRRIHRTLVVLSLAVSPAALGAQTPEPVRGEDARRMIGHDPISRLLAERESLGLTADQVARLEAIRSRLEAENRPHRERLREARAEFRAERRERLDALTPAQRDSLRERRAARRAEVRERMEALRPTLRQLRENRRAALAEARAVLTDEQRERLRELRAERAAERGDRPHRRGGRGPHGHPRDR